MSLDWRFTNQEVYDALPKSLTENSITSSLIWATLAVHIGEIKESNIDEWIFRFKYLSRVNRIPSFIRDDDGNPVPYIPTRTQLSQRLGLWTNMSTMPRKKWIQKIAESIEIDIEREMKIEQEQAA